MFSILTTITYCIAYFPLRYLFSKFFANDNEMNMRDGNTSRSLGIIVLFCVVAFAIVYLTPDREIANRIQHGFAGGFAAFLICFLAVKDSGAKVSRFQFLVFTALVVTALGVGNEIFEFFLQNYTNLVMATTINDTWLDLISNSLGILLAGVIFTPFIRIQDRESSLLESSEH
jgi:hypothetical protein